MFDFTNITSVTRSLVNTLRCDKLDGPKINITCAVLEIDGKIGQIQIDDANTQNVRLKGAILPQGEEMMTPHVRWINQLSASFYQNLVNENSYNFIITHAPLLSYGATNLKVICKRRHSTKVILMVHSLPRTEQGHLDKGLLCSWISGADIVVEVGATESNVLKRFIHGKIHKVYIPLYPLKPAARLPKHKHKKVSLPVGTKEKGYNGTHLKLAIAAIAGAVDQMSSKDETLEIETVLMGDESVDEGDMKAFFYRTIDEQGICQDIMRFSFLPSQEKGGSESRTLKTCMMESALFLLPLRKNYSVFGLEALTAIMAGIPILVSENSGVAALLHDMGEDTNNVVRQRKDFDSNVRAWAEYISEKILNQSKVVEETLILRESLLKSTLIGTTHLNFISTITRMFCHYIID